MRYQDIISAILLICLCFSIITGCVLIHDRVIITYESEYDATVQASEDTLAYLKIPILLKISDKLKTTLRARRTDGTIVIVDVIRIDQYQTQISVRTDTFSMDKGAANQIHEFINERLGQSLEGRLKARGTFC